MIYSGRWHYHTGIQTHSTTVKFEVFCCQNHVLNTVNINKVHEYMKDPRIVNQQALDGLYQNVEQVDVVSALRVFENKNSIVSELGLLLKSEEKRRLAKSQLEEVEKRSALKKQLKQEDGAKKKERATVVSV